MPGRRRKTVALTQGGIGAQLRAERRRRNWSQAELGRRLAEALGRPLPFSQASVSDFERGVAELPGGLLAKLPELFDQESRFDRSASATSTSLWGPSVFDEWPEFPALHPLAEDELSISAKFYADVARLALLNQIRSVDKKRLVKRLGMLKPDTMRRVDRALQISVGLVPL